MMLASVIVEPIIPSRIKQSGCNFELPTFPDPLQLLMTVAFVGFGIVWWYLILRDRPSHQNGWLFILFSVVWTVLGPLSLLWKVIFGVFGTETVGIEQGALLINRSILAIPLHHRQYDESEVRRLRVSSVGRSRGSISRSVAFDYGSKTIHFAESLKEAEMYELVDLLSQCSARIAQNRLLQRSEPRVPSSLA